MDSSSKSKETRNFNVMRSTENLRELMFQVHLGDVYDDDVEEISDNLVMSEVYNTIKEIDLKSNGAVLREDGNPGSGGGAGVGKSHTGRGCN
nr:movement protein [Allamanda chlorotic virus B]